MARQNATDPEPGTESIGDTNREGNRKSYLLTIRKVLTGCLSL